MRSNAFMLFATVITLTAACAMGDLPAPYPYSDVQLRRILALGPWPPPRATDPSNRVSGNPAAIAFGDALFRTPMLSHTGTIACATCHQPGRAFADGLPRARGVALADRNTTSLANVASQRWYGWDGAADNLWAQSLRPILDRREMNSDFTHVAAAIRADNGLRARYHAAFGTPPSADDEEVAVNVAKALAAFQETLVTGRTPFDDFRDALARDDRAAAARYPMPAQRGLAIFVGSGNCSVCHGGPRFSNGEFHDIGIPFFVEPGRVTLSGRAWSGQGSISRVEVGVDEHWADARLGGATGDFAWRGWSFEWDASPGDHELSCRATDASGGVQPTDQPWNVQGMGNNLVQRIAVTVA